MHILDMSSSHVHTGHMQQNDHKVQTLELVVSENIQYIDL